MTMVAKIANEWQDYKREIHSGGNLFDVTPFLEF